MQFLNKEYDIKIWNNEILSDMIAIDTETDIRSFNETPDLITFQAFDGKAIYYVERRRIDAFFVLNYKVTIIFHNASFDIDVIEKASAMGFHDHVESEKIYDTSIMYRLLHLAEKGWVPHKYNLAMLTKEYLGEELNKDDAIRLNFEQFRDVPIIDIPMEYLEYGARDVVATYYLYRKLLAGIERTGSSTCLSHNIQLAGDIALNRVRKRGIGFNLTKARDMLKGLQNAMYGHAEMLAVYGWVRGQKGAQNRYERIVRDFLKLDLPLTEDGSISSKEEDLSPYNHIPFVKAYLKFHELEKQTTFIRELKNERVHPKYNILVNTGRTSCSKPNFQQLPRSGNIRSCFRSSAGRTLIITDYSAIELATLAQITYKKYGYSKMREAINDNIDLHRYYAAILHDKDESDITKLERQEAKAANFGFPGGLGIETFIAFSKGYGLTLTKERAKEMKEKWFSAFPEMKLYMNEEVGDAWTLTGRKRGNPTYCAAKNTPFQGLAADGAKIALYYLDQAGINVVGFVHDEIVSEIASEDAEKTLKLQEQIMIDSMQIVCPDVKIKVESQISEVYTK